MRSTFGVSALVALTLAACSEGDLELSSRLPSADVRLTTDTRGITHVYASTDADAMYGAGYAMARDRLFQMELVRRRTRGRMAEVLGDARRKDDLAARAIGFAELGAADLARMRRERPADAALLDAWAAGVNARIAEVRSGKAPRPYGLRSEPGELDLVPEPWTAEDGTVVGKFLSFGLSSTLDSEILATAITKIAPKFASRYPLFAPAFQADPLSRGVATSKLAHVPAGPLPAPVDAKGLAPIRFSFIEGATSNNWAVTAAHSYNGRPLLAGDPHQALTSPTRLYPIHVSSVKGGGTLDVLGFSFVGTPLVELGHNGRVAWTATTAFADVMDLWGVDTDASGDTVLLPSGPVAVVTTTSKVKVRLPDGSMIETEAKRRVVPGYGVLLPDEALPLPKSLLTSHDEILFAWTGFAPTLEGSAYLAMDRAKNLGEWEAATDLIEVGAMNFVAADAKDVSYHVSMRLPDRGAPSEHPMPTRILEAEEAAGTFWTGAALPLDRLPRQRNPERGFLATANSDPFGFTFDGDVSNDPFYYGSFFANGMRTRRIEDALSAAIASGKPVTHADMEALQRDVKSLMADVLVPKLEQATKDAATDPALKDWKLRDDLFALQKRLSAWDRNLRADSPDALLFTLFQWHATRRCFSDELGALLFDAVAEKSPPYLVGALRNVVDGRVDEASQLLPEGGVSLLLLQALDDAQLTLIERFGTPDLTDRRLSDMVKASFPSTYGGRLDVPHIPIGGGLDTIDVAPASPFVQKGDALATRDELTVVEMALYRMVTSFDPDGTPRATGDFARGTSEDPDSRHFEDQQPSWVASEHLPFWFREKEVQDHEESRTVLPAAK